MSVEEEKRETRWDELGNPVLCSFSKNGSQVFSVRSQGDMEGTGEREGREQKRKEENERKHSVGR